jgi:hypothetical protein
LSFVYVSQDFSNACALIFFCTLMGFYGLDLDGWYSIGINDYFRMLFGFVTLPELVKYLRVERYLAAKIGTISLGPLCWVVFVMYG